MNHLKKIILLPICSLVLVEHIFEFLKQIVKLYLRSQKNWILIEVDLCDSSKSSIYLAKEKIRTTKVFECRPSVGKRE
uniref:Uncharacterized protein n=1 Tax=Physcomitrium patens TaxID=3218 RepID=A0A2K1J7L7_PHYPA|nr:hypothetical protein PHYPA_020630 [Physcomitrium patens]